MQYAVPQYFEAGRELLQPKLDQAPGIYLILTVFAARYLVLPSRRRPIMALLLPGDSMCKAGGGSIVNISSIAGRHGTPGLAAYGASKWGVRSLTRTAAYELARDNIRVNSVHAGIIDTPLAYDPKTGDELVPVDHFAIPRMASVDEIVRYVLFVASNEAAFSTGSEFVADGGFALGPIP